MLANIVPPSSAPLSPKAPGVDDDAVPTPPRMLVAAAKTKRNSHEEICQKMRDAKKAKSQEVLAQEQNQEKLFGDEVVDQETMPKGDLLLQCIKTLGPKLVANIGRRTKRHSKENPEELS